MGYQLLSTCVKDTYRRWIINGAKYPSVCQCTARLVAPRRHRPKVSFNCYGSHMSYTSASDDKGQEIKYNPLLFKLVDSDAAVDGQLHGEDGLNDYGVDGEYTNPIESCDDSYSYPLSVRDLAMDRKGDDAFPRLRLEKEPVNIPAVEADLKTLMEPKRDVESWLSKNHIIAKNIEECLKKKLHPNCSVVFFGSAINGLWTDTSDLDICIKVPNVASRGAIIRNLRRISQLLEPLYPHRVFEYRFTARIPILHWKESRRSNKKTQSVHEMYEDPEPVTRVTEPAIDISINNSLAVANSALVGAYVNYDERVRTLILCLKQWAHSRDLNDRSKGTFGSFALSLMAIHFLQRCKPPILPSLQDLALCTNEPPVYVDGIDCRFTTDKDKIDKEMELLKGGANTNSSSVGDLLIDFFRYFGWLHQRLPEWPICIRSVDPSVFKSSSTNKNNEANRNVLEFNAQERFMHVDNPFEMGVDVANIAIHQRSRITVEMRRAYRILNAGYPFKTILHTDA